MLEEISRLAVVTLASKYGDVLIPERCIILATHQSKSFQKRKSVSMCIAKS